MSIQRARNVPWIDRAGFGVGVENKKMLIRQELQLWSTGQKGASDNCDLRNGKWTFPYAIGCLGLPLKLKHQDHGITRTVAKYSVHF